MKIDDSGTNSTSKDYFTIARLNPLQWEKKTVFRALVGLFLLATGLTIGVLGHQLLTDNETKLFEDQFDVITDRAINDLQKSLRTKELSLRIMSSVYTAAFSSPNQWPNVSYSGFKDLATTLTEQAEVTNIAFLPLVLPSQVQSFVAFAYQLFQTDPDTPAGTGDFSFGRGIAAVNNSNPTRDGLYNDLTGASSWGSPYNVQTPILQLYPARAEPLLVDFHSFSLGGSSVDRVLSCAEQRVKGDEDTRCHTIADFPKVGTEDLPSLSYLEPVYVLNSTSEVGSSVVGFIHALSPWVDILSDLVPFFDFPVLAVIQVEGNSYTYSLGRGEVFFLGRGDHHDSRYSGYGRMMLVCGHEDDDDEGLASGSPVFKVWLYPTQEMEGSYRSLVPLVAILVGIGAVLLTSVVFLVYDYFVKEETLYTLRVLETKRKFVRFISHELRTPLNTVCMGLDLLASDLVEVNRKVEQRVRLLKDGVKDPWWRGLIRSTDSCEETRKDVLENALEAVAVLNDLVNFDKIEAGTLRLDISPVSVYDVVARCVGLFHTRAEQKGVRLTLKIAELDRAVEGMERVNHADRVRFSVVSGDVVRLEQIFKNLVSNAIKFTPSNGCIDVTVNFLDQKVLRTYPHSGSYPPSILKSSDSFPDLARPRNHQQGFKTQVGECGTQLEPIGFLEVSVKDSGVGLTPTQVAAVGSEGVKFDTTELLPDQGSGIGLCISKGLIALHGGLLSVHSEGTGSGATFSVLLPAFESGLDRRGLERKGLASVGISGSVSTGIGSSGLGSGSMGTGLMTSGSTGTGLSGREWVGLHSRDLELGVGGGRTVGAELPAIREGVIPEFPSQLSAAEITFDLEDDQFFTPPPVDSTGASGVSGGKEGSARERRVLVVDDSKLNRKMLVRLLERRGHQCEEAEDGLEAIEKVFGQGYPEGVNPAPDCVIQKDDDDEEYTLIDTEIELEEIDKMGYRTIRTGEGGLSRFDTVLMDYEMPKMNGPTACKRLRDLGFTGLIVGITGNVLPEDRRFYLNQGAEAVLGKPLDMKELQGIWENK